MTIIKWPSRRRMEEKLSWRHYGVAREPNGPSLRYLRRRWWRLDCGCHHRARLLDSSRERNNPTRPSLKDYVAPLLLAQLMPALSVDSASPVDSATEIDDGTGSSWPTGVQIWISWKTFLSNGPGTRRYEIRNPAVVFINTCLMKVHRVHTRFTLITIWITLKPTHGGAPTHKSSKTQVRKVQF